MKKLILALLAALTLFGSAQANTEGPAWDKFPTKRLTGRLGEDPGGLRARLRGKSFLFRSTRFRFPIPVSAALPQDWGMAEFRLRGLF